jgi:hypothetical protein
MVAGIESLFATFALHAIKKHAAFSTWSSTFFYFLFEDMLKCFLLKTQKMGRGKQCTQGKGKLYGKATLSGPASQDYVEQIPDGMNWLIIHNSTVVTELTIDVRNLVAKIRKSKIIELL